MDSNLVDESPKDRTAAEQRFADLAAWRRLLSAEGLPAFSEAWLAIFCAELDLALGALAGGDRTVRQGMVALGDPGTNKYARTAWTGRGKEVSLLLARAAERAMQIRRATVQQGETPDAPCQLAHPILVKDRLYGVVAIEMEGAAQAHLDLAMRLAQWAAAWFDHLFQPKALASSEEGELSSLQVEALRHCAADGSASAAAESFATFLADRLGAQKVSLGLRRGLKTRLLAVSHGGFSSVPNEYLAVLIAAMDEAVDSGGRIACPVVGSELAMPHAAHHRLCRAHDCDWAQSTPFRCDLGDPGESQFVLTVEGMDTPPEGLDRRIAGVADLVVPFFAARLRAERSIPRQVNEAIAAEWRRLSGWGAWRRQVLYAAAVCAVAALFLVKVDYRVSADASLEGVIRRAIVAPFDGYVAQARVRPGDKVAAGAELGRLDDRDLTLQQLDLQAHLAEAQKQIDAAMGQRDNAKVNIITARKAEVQAELDLVNDNLKRAALVAPFDAYVVSGDLTELIGAPVHRGDTLYEVSPLNGFRVVVEVGEFDFAEVDTGQDGNLLLSSMPYRSFPFHIVRITPIASAHDGKTVFRVEAQLAANDPVMRPGMQGVASIDVGPRRLIWIGTHRIVDWLRIKLWEWLP